MNTANDNYKENDQILAFATFFPFFSLMIQSLLYNLLGETLLIHIMILIVSTIPMLFAVKIWIKYHLVYASTVYFVTILILLLSYFIFPENRVGYWSRLSVDFLLMCLPCFINISIIKDNKNILDVLSKISFFIWAFGISIFIIKISGKSILNENYSMSFSSYMLLPSLFYIYQFIVSKKILYMLISFSSFLAVVLIGSRGAAVSWGLYLIIGIIYSNHNKLVHLSSVVIGLTIYFYGTTIVEFFYRFIKKIGIESRTIELIRLGKVLTYQSGRQQLQRPILNAINEHPIIGNGISSEYTLIGTYSHNIFLDIILNGGILFGGIFILIIFIQCIRKFILEDDKLFFWLLFCYGFIPMIISGSYLSSIPFWIFLGYVSNNRKMKIVFSKMASI